MAAAVVDLAVVSMVDEGVSPLVAVTVVVIAVGAEAVSLPTRPPPPQMVFPLST